MESLLWRIRVAVLWVIVAVGMSAGTLLGLASPGTLGEVTAGRVGDMEITSGLLILFALFWLVPFAMAFLTLVLRDPVINRYANAGVGVVVTGGVQRWPPGRCGHDCDRTGDPVACVEVAQSSLRGTVG